jgi:heme/copper-type cytochrome/quinol oxidase subunit 2
MFRPEKAGRYVFECSKLCGAGHSFMRGVIVVSE